ncbi:hypothetical protein MKEN_01180800 [Mycena kentingensis (nom. inval.)]|nr:hypothetical protein MKEN_01180800 [Mycena kentingensis (nom. inval.)]
MSSNSLFAMARSKLSRAPSGDSRDSFSLHRWVLLKNSIIQSPPLSTSSSANTAAATPLPDDDGDDDGDSFMFPDAGKLMQGISTESAASEAAWLDSLLETLGEDDDETDVNVSVVPVDDDDEDLPPSPSISPMSSSDDLHCYYPFLVPYPPYSPPPSPSLSTAPFTTLPYADPLPYCDFDDLDDLPVPEAIEDTSDDESDAPPTPGQSLSSLNPTSIPLPPEHSSLRISSPHIHIDDDEDYFYHFDPLPFASHNHPPPPLEYAQC